jgi:adenylate kinase
MDTHDSGTRSAARIAFVMFGNMCAGKTSAARVLEHETGHVVVAVNKLVKRNLDAASEEVKARRAKGYLLPDDVVTGWVFDEVGRVTADDRTVILDGFPRTAAQAESLVARCTSAPRVVYPEVDMTILEQRYTNRLLCDACGMPYSKLFTDFDGSCVLCGGTSLSPRPTDRPDYFHVKTGQFEAESRGALPVLRGGGFEFLTLQHHDTIGGLLAEVRAIAGGACDGD